MIKPWRAQVYLVGAGPGDPGLLTRRGAALLRRADVVLYDNLTSPRLLTLVQPEARKVYVGKKARQARPDQEWINEQLIGEARAGRTVVRLKGGDSFVFGRGGEEVLALAQAGIRFEVVPGVTSAVAAPASAGVPVTYRGSNTALHIAVGFEDPDSPECSVDWETLGATGQTVVIMMATHYIQGVLRRLSAGGLPPETPVMTVHHGTYPTQKSKRTTLGEALANSELVYLPPPSITVVGEVAGSPESFNWFEARPLFGRRFVVLRAEESGADYAGELEEAGAFVEVLPATRFETIETAEPLDVTLARHEGGWVILPSTTAIRFFFDRLEAEGFDARRLAGLRMAAVGEQSARDLKSRGVRADFVPAVASGATLAATLPGAAGDPVLIAGSRQSRPELRDGLAARGFAVTHLPLYETLPDDAGLDQAAALLGEGGWEFVAFAPSAAQAVHVRAGGAMASVKWWAIGGTTAAALRDLGVEPAGAARHPSPEGLVEAILAQGAT